MWQLSISDLILEVFRKRKYLLWLILFYFTLERNVFIQEIFKWKNSFSDTVPKGDQSHKISCMDGNAWMVFTAIFCLQLRNFLIVL